VATRATDAQPFILAADVMRTDIIPLLADDSVEQAMELCAEFDVLALPVVDSHASNQPIGIVRRSQLASAFMKQLEGTSKPEV
jgi:CBS-domain-containing membrane protein